VRKRDKKDGVIVGHDERKYVICDYGVSSDKFRFQSEYNIEPTAKPIKIAL
jgi:hypothetical protein